MRRKFSASVFAWNEGKVLLINHKLLNLWLPVGGELEDNETPLEAATRELWEETSLIGEFPSIKGQPDGTPPGFIGYEEHAAGPKGYHMNFCFVCKVKDRTVGSDGSFTEHRWIDSEEAKKLNCPQNVLDLICYIESFMW